MNISLSLFEQQIPETILKRGLGYYKKERIIDFTEVSSGEYEVVVEGGKEYIVNFRVRNDQMIDPVCTCPYDEGVCKHVVAAIFYFLNRDKNSIHELKHHSKKKSAKKQAIKKKSKTEQIEDILKQVSLKDLQDFIMTQVNANENFADVFLSRFAYLNQQQSKELFAKQLRTALRKILAGRGYIDYYRASQVSKIGQQFIESAIIHLEQQHYVIVWYMGIAMLEVFTDALQFTDDSNGDVGDFISEAVRLIQELSNKKLPEELRKECFNYCGKAYEEKKFDGWDWHYIMMDIAIQLIQTKEEASELEQLLLLNTKKGERDYDVEVAEVQLYNIILKTQGDDIASVYLSKKLHNSDLRKKAIENALVNDKYDYAIKLAEEGIQNDEKKYPGLANDWREYLLKIYCLKNDKTNIIKYAFHLFIHSIQSTEEQYQLILQQTAPEDHEKMIDKIIRELMKTGRFDNMDRIARIYTQEQRWSDLFDLLQQNPSMTMLDMYEKYLPENFREPVNTLYLQEVQQLLEQNTGRKHYEIACKYLRKLKKRGGRELVTDYVDKLKKQYPKRKALMEELDLV